ncbi:MAG: heavy metal translocating P-type ATPase, partial [bacterium]|nr:heavy metal translocating P-type ATPase [bacterium]
MITKTSRIKGMHCASCAAIIEKTFKKTEGVESVSVNYGTETAKVSFDESKTNLETLSKKIEPLGYSLLLSQLSAEEMGMSDSEHAEHLGLNQSKKEKLAELASMKKKLLTAIPLAIISVIFMAWEIFSKFAFIPEMPIFLKNILQNLMPLMAAYTLFYVGQPYLMGFFRFLKYGKANMDTLIGIGTSVAFTYSLVVTIFKDILEKFINVENVYFDVTIVVITFITLGKYLEARSKIKTGDAIEKLINMQAKTALVFRNGQEQEISISEVVHGDLILIKPAGKIPVDGVITEGSSYVDESMITGEPIPVKKDIGENVVAGTINTSGAFTFKATKVGSETMLAHIIKMVEDAQGSKAPIQALVDKISAVFVPVVLVTSFVVLGLWLLVGSRYMEFSQAMSFGLVSFVGILVIACPCALGLATPTAIIVGVGKGAKEGILIKDAATLEKLHKANVVVVDKTGTLTKGRPELISIKNFSDKKDEELISVLASLEKNSEHPIAHSVIDYAKDKNISFAQINGFEAIKGKGVKGTVNNIEYYAGNIKLVRDLNIQFDSSLIEKDTAEGKTPIIIAEKEKVLGVVMIADA